MKSIVVKNLEKIYNEGLENEVRALNGISFTLAPGTFAVVLGPSGAGKSTLLNILGGMDDATRGEYLVGDMNVASFKSKELALFRRQTIGFVFQFYNLMPNLTALENVELAASVAKEPLDSLDIIKRVGLGNCWLFFLSQLF